MIDSVCPKFHLDAEVTCDKDSTLEVHVGDNVTVQCEVRLYPTALYKWFKVSPQPHLNRFHFIHRCSFNEKEMVSNCKCQW